MVLLCIVFLEEKSVEKLDRMKDGLVSNFHILHASNAEKPHSSSPIKRKASSIIFLLQKLCCQKAYWDQVRLPSLVNK